MTFLSPILRFCKESPSKNGITITVSGPSGSGKNTIAEAIAEKFNLKLVNTGDIFRQTAKELRIDLERISKNVPAELHMRADAKTLDTAMDGGHVIIGRLSGWAAGKFADCRVFINTPLETRALWVSKRESISFEDAYKKLALRDKSDTSSYLEVYDVDVTDLSIYDLIIDNSKMSIDETNQFVIERVTDHLEKNKKV